MNDCSVKIVLDRETMPDSLYNNLLQNFVNEAVALGVSVTKYSKFENWVITCEVKQHGH